MIAGIKIPFVSSPIQYHVPQEIKCPNREKYAIDREIAEYLRKGIIQYTNPSEGQYVSQIFPRPKKSGGLRIILNLRKLNLDVEYDHFKMETLQAAILLMEKDQFMASLDLEDAYYSCNVAESYRKYLCFYWNNQLFQFTCLPNGLSCAPRFFTKILKPIYENLRSRGFISSYYLDDSWLCADSFEQCVTNVEETKKLFVKAGFIINEKKSVQITSQKIDFLGFCLDSKQMTISLPLKKVENIKNLCSEILKENRIKIRSLAKFIGILVSSLPGVNYGELYYRFLEKNKNLALRESFGNYDGFTSLSEEAKEEVLWWQHNVEGSPKNIRAPPVDLVIAMDASKAGWGAHFNGLSTGGHWTESESLLHINVLELKAVFFGLKSFLNDASGKHIRVRCDNTTTVSYINHLGGVKSIDCHKQTRGIWEWAMARKLLISAEFIAGKINTEADEASRIFDENTEWAIPNNIFLKIQENFMKFDIDLFASRLNAKVSRYAAWKPDPNASIIDAFSLDWKNISFYAFPPFSIILKSLRKVKSDQATGVLICPIWPTQPWFPLIMKMLVNSPLILPPNILYLPFNPTVKHKQCKSLRLMACHLSGNSLLTKGFQRNLSKSCVLPGEVAQKPNTRATSKNGFISVLEGKPIQCNFMKWL